MYSLGEGKQGDVLRAQVEVARMTEEIERMESMRAAMAGRLAATLGVPVDSLRGNTVLPSIPDSLPPLADLIAQAELRRPMIQAGERDVAAAIAGERLARREMWPDLQLGLQYGWRGGEMGTDRMGSLMIGAALPIHARSRQLAMRKEAAAMRLMATADLAVMRAETRARMTELHPGRAHALNQNPHSPSTLIPPAPAAALASFSAYRVGSVDFMTLLENRMAVNTYRMGLVALEAERGRTVAEMEMLLGRELFDPAITMRPGR